MDVEKKVVFQPGVTWERRVGLAMGTQMAVPGEQVGTWKSSHSRWVNAEREKYNKDRCFYFKIRISFNVSVYMPSMSVGICFWTSLMLISDPFASGSESQLPVTGGFVSLA